MGKPRISQFTTDSYMPRIHAEGTRIAKISNDKSISVDIRVIRFIRARFSLNKLLP